MMTIGHSNRPWEEFLAMLAAHRVDVLIDVRSIPRSRYNPQFNKETIPRPLAAAGIEYLHLPGLGGRRHPHTDSPNKGWQNPSFRGYADYMQTAEFQHNVAELLELAKERRPALMCAEAVPWRCHRSLIADALVVLGVKVEHLMSATRADPHKLTSFAQVDSGRLTYPPPGLELFPGQ
jgi:uncharacterized protein (DUF488 family)